MPRSWNDSWLQKSLKTLQRGHWDLPDISSGCFLHWFFQGAFPSSFQKKRNCSSCQPRSTFHQTLWHCSVQWHRAPGFGGAPLCSRVRNMDCCWKCNWSTQPAEQQAPRQGENSPTPVAQVGHRQYLSPQLNKFYSNPSLLNSATAFPIYQCPLQRNKKVFPYLTKELRIPKFLPNWTTCQELKRQLYEPTHYCYKLAKSNKSAAYIWCYTVSWVRQEKSKTVLHPL